MPLQTVLIALALAVALAGCASAPAQSESTQSAIRRCNSATMAAVERAAWNQNVQVDVIWVNPPRSRRCTTIAL